MTLLCVTGVEDRLQDGVRHTLELLRLVLVMEINKLFIHTKYT